MKKKNEVKEQDVAYVAVPTTNQSSNVYKRKKTYFEIEGEESNLPQANSLPKNESANGTNTKQIQNRIVNNPQEVATEVLGYGHQIVNNLNKNQEDFGDVQSKAENLDKYKNVFTAGKSRKDKQPSPIKTFWQKHKAKIISIGVGFLFAAAGIAISILCPPAGLVAVLGAIGTIAVFGVGGFTLGAGGTGTGFGIASCFRKKSPPPLLDFPDDVIESQSFPKETKSNSDDTAVSAGNSVVTEGLTRKQLPPLPRKPVDKSCSAEARAKVQTESTVVVNTNTVSA